MADLYANENFPRQVVVELRALGHDVLTSHEAGNAGRKVPDEAVLVLAHAQSRAVLTHNRADFRKLHRHRPNHAGIIICTEDTDFAALAQRIHQALQTHDSLQGQLLRVIRPATSNQG